MYVYTYVCFFAEAQVLFVQTLSDLVAEEGQDVRLEVELSLETAEVQWMKQGILLQQSPKFLMEAYGYRRALTIRGLELTDRGTYRCESLHDRTQAKLSVERMCWSLASSPSSFRLAVNPLGKNSVTSVYSPWHVVCIKCKS